MGPGLLGKNPCNYGIDVLFSIIVFPNVSPLSLLALNTGINTPVLFVHQVTTTLLPEAAMSTFRCTTLPLLGALSTSVFPSVLPPSILFAKKTPQWPVSLFGHAV